METMKTSINNLPDQSMMELFLTIGNKLELFKTYTEKWVNGSYTFYAWEFVLADLIAACSYLNMHEHEDEKKQFLDWLKKENLEKMMKDLWIFCLKYWKFSEPNSSFVQARYEKQMKDLEWRKGIDLLDLPIISTKILPKWYHDAVENHTLIHEKFEQELERRKSISQEADKIQQSSVNHSFWRDINQEEISNLEDKL